MVKIMKLLVCDDDVSTVSVLEEQIDYAKLGIDTFLKAYNGIKAKQIIDKEKPELVLCDIGMPKENGLEVLKYVYDSHLDIEFSFLTCYESFEYAKKAVQYGASDYINKPFEIEEIIICLQKMIANHQKKKMLSMQDAKKATKKDVVRRIGDGLYFNENQIERALKDNEIDIDINEDTRIVLTYSDITKAITERWSSELLFYSCEEIHERVFEDQEQKSFSNCYIDNRYIWNISILTNCDDEEELIEQCESIREYYNTKMSLDPVILVMDSFEFKELPNRLTLAYRIIRKIRGNRGRVYFEEEAKEYLNLEKDQINDNQVLRLIKNRDNEEYLNYIRKISEPISHDEDNLNQFKMELENIFITALKDNGIPHNTLFGKPEVLSYKDKNITSQQLLLNYAEVLMNELSQIKQESVDSEDIIARAKKYIDENYRENIDRDDVAAIAFVTPNYLSKQFKIKTGMNLREYINKLRIQEAQRLLLSTDTPITSIALYVGFDNVSYFSTVFKRYSDMSPLEWREKK